MRKNVMKCAAAAIIAAAGMASAGFPVSAGSSAYGSGNLIYEEDSVSFYASDLAYLCAEAEAIQKHQGMAKLPDMRKDTARRENIRSRGVLNYADGTVVIDSADLFRLADQIDGLDAAYQNSTVKAVDALHRIGTYFRSDGAVTHAPDEADSGENALKLPYQKICEGILQSQSVAHLADQKICAAFADNLSRGTAAWVDGTLLVGNGADNDNHYKNGYTAGEAAGYQSGHADGIREAETNVNPSSASYQEGYAQGKADAAPVILTGTFSDFEDNAIALSGSVQIPAGLTYVCAGINSVTECDTYRYPPTDMWRVGTSWNYNSETGTVTFHLGLGGPKYLASKPVMSYTIMYIP